MSVETFPPSSAPQENRDPSADDKDFSRLTGSLTSEDIDKIDYPTTSGELDPNDYASATGSFSKEDLDTDSSVSGNLLDNEEVETSISGSLTEADADKIDFPKASGNLDPNDYASAAGSFSKGDLDMDPSVSGSLAVDQEPATSSTSGVITDAEIADFNTTQQKLEALRGIGTRTASVLDALNEPYAPTTKAYKEHLAERAKRGIDGSLTLNGHTLESGTDLPVSDRADPAETLNAYDESRVEIPHEKTPKGNKIKGALGAIARKLTDYLGIVPAEEASHTRSGNLVDPQESQGEKQPADRLLDIKDQLYIARLTVHDIKERALAAKDKVMGFANLGILYATSGLASLGEAAAKTASGANNFRSEYFTNPAPTEDDPDHREVNALGKLAILSVGMFAVAAALNFGLSINGERGQQAADAANQMNGTGFGGTDPTQTTVNGPSAGSIFPDNAEPSQTHLPIIEDAPSGQTGGVEATTGDLSVNFSPDTGHLEAGDTIWDDSMKSLTEGGFNGSPDELTERTNILTEWRLEKMGISPEQAKFLPIGTELPTPNFAELQELIAKAEQLKQ